MLKQKSVEPENIFCNSALEVDIQCTTLLLYINCALSDAVAPSNHILSVTFSVILTFLNTRHFFTHKWVMNNFFLEPYLTTDSPFTYFSVSSFWLISLLTNTLYSLHLM
jgi:hypothetical protein